MIRPPTSSALPSMRYRSSTVAARPRDLTAMFHPPDDGGWPGDCSTGRQMQNTCASGNTLTAHPAPRIMTAAHAALGTEDRDDAHCHETLRDSADRSGRY